MGETMNYVKNMDALRDLYKKWGDKRFPGQELLSADDMLSIAKLSKKQRKIARAAMPFNKITKADFDTLNKKKK